MLKLPLMRSRGSPMSEPRAARSKVRPVPDVPSQHGTNLVDAVDILSRNYPKPKWLVPDLLREQKATPDRALTTAEIKENLSGPGWSGSNVDVTLSRMVEEGQISRAAHGKYCLASAGLPNGAC
jgi:hypothetical protein